MSAVDHSSHFEVWVMNFIIGVQGYNPPAKTNWIDFLSRPQDTISYNASISSCRLLGQWRTGILLLEMLLLDKYVGYVGWMN